MENRRDAYSDNMYEEKRTPISPKLVLIIISGLFLLYSGYNLLKSKITKNYQAFTVETSGRCNLMTKDAAAYQLLWTAKYELYDKELYELFGEEFETELTDRINLIIRKYYHINKIVDTLLFEELYKNPTKIIGNIINEIELDTTSLNIYLPYNQLAAKRLFLQQIGFIESDQDYNYVVHIKPTNLVLTKRSPCISYSQQLINIIANKQIAQQKVIEAETNVAKSKSAEAEAEALLIVQTQLAELRKQEAIEKANRDRREAEAIVKRAIEDQKKREAEIIAKTRKHILDSINN